MLSLRHKSIFDPRPLFDWSTFDLSLDVYICVSCLLYISHHTCFSMYYMCMCHVFYMYLSSQNMSDMCMTQTHIFKFVSTYINTWYRLIKRKHKKYISCLFCITHACHVSNWEIYVLCFKLGRYFECLAQIDY